MPVASLQNKVILIMGGTTGLGWSAAQACVRAGSRVLLVGRDSSHLADAVAKLGSAAEGLCGDATLAETSVQAVERAVQRWGQLDGLYHVAGGSGRRQGDGPLDQITESGWNHTMTLNLDSLFFSNRAATQQFLEQGSGGSILNMASVLGFSPAPRYFATHAYATAKSAVIGLTRSCAAYYAPQGIRFNAVCPALVETPMSQRALSDAETMTYIQDKQPLHAGRAGQPADLDDAVVYFLSDGSQFTTGQVLSIDGGWSVSEPQPCAAETASNNAPGTGKPDPLPKTQPPT
ncbi:MAG: SDR family oxidoreductase [Planctomycetota bacterium]|nr:SDR family oxidoreductase [Planctomycetota bacterium]